MRLSPGEGKGVVKAAAEWAWKAEFFSTIIADGCGHRNIFYINVWKDLWKNCSCRALRLQDVVHGTKTEKNFPGGAKNTVDRAAAHRL